MNFYKFIHTQIDKKKSSNDKKILNSKQFSQISMFRWEFNINKSITTQSILRFSEIYGQERTVFHYMQEV